MATCKFKVGDRVIVGESNIGNQYIGQVGVVVEVDCNYDYPYCVNDTSYGNRLWCKATGYAHKFKVGDMVIGNDPNRYGITKKGWIGKVIEVRNSNSIRVYGKGIECETDFCVDPKYFDLYAKAESKVEEKIVITRDGKTTTATKYCGDGSKVTATARCAPEDTFDFNVGAELAMERLMGKTKSEPPKYYNGRVVCVDTGHTDLTVGKIYTFVDGCGKSDDGRQITNSPVKDFNDLASRFHVAKFIEIVEDENKPLTIEELNKMDGQKVYVVRLDKNKVENPNHSYCGWHTVDVKKGRLIDSKNLHYNISSMDKVHGYHAYRQAPLK